MACSARTAMRLLSPRVQCLQRKPNAAVIRHASSRYSNPSKRESAPAAPAREPSFAPSSRDKDYESISSQQAMHNPLDVRAAIIAREEKRQYHIRRMRFAGMGLLLSLASLAALLYNIDLDQMERAEEQKKNVVQLDASDVVNQQFQGKQVHVIGVGGDKRIVAHGPGEDVELVETGTSSVPHFPRKIYLPTSPDSTNASSGALPNSAANPGNLEDLEQYTLVGLGIRSVSFLSIQVYVVGMYCRTQDLSALQEKLIHFVNENASTLIPSEKEELLKRLLDPTQSREIWSELLKVPGLQTAWRIAPTRNTDFGHLRDGWITGINNRTREARALAQGVETEYDAEDFGKSVGNFKSIFSGGKAPKGSVMILARQKNGALNVWFQAKPDASGENKEMQKLGTVADERIARLIWLGYLAGEKVSSEPARQGVAAGCVGFAGRPVGSAESMVT